MGEPSILWIFFKVEGSSTWSKAKKKFSQWLSSAEVASLLVGLKLGNR